MGFSVDAIPDTGVMAGAGTGGVVATLGFYTTALSLITQVNYVRDSAGYSIDLGNNGVDVYTDGSQISVNFDAANSLIKLRYKDTSGTPQTLAATAAYTPGSIVPVLLTTEQAGVNAAYAGQLVTSSFVTAAPNITAPVLTGAVDPCGNAI